MSATDELRRLLDERGVKWTEEDGHTLWWGESAYHRASAYSSVLFGEDGRVYLNAMVTPEQAIAATLGNDGVERSKNGVAERERDQLKAENAKLRELVVRMSRALDIDGDWCHRECYAEFRCSGSCAIADAMVGLGIAEYEEEYK